MASKALLLFGALLVFALFVTSEVAAEQAQGKNENNVRVEGYGRGGYNPGYGGGYHGGPGYGGGYRGRPGYCRWGCCRHGYRGGCSCCMHPDEIPEPMYIPEVQN